MATQAGDGSSSSPFTSSDGVPVPAAAVELLRSCMQTRNDGAAATEKVREAMVLICLEAHRTDVTPEGLLVALKNLCHGLPEFEQIRGARERHAFLDMVVKMAIEEYYRL
jgi:hypothetical protein